MNKIRPSCVHLLTISKQFIMQIGCEVYSPGIIPDSESYINKTLELNHDIESPVNANVRIILGGLDGCDSRIFQD